MINKITESPFLNQPRAWWLPLLSLIITLHGIFFLHWDLQPIVFLFWWEVILIIGAALIRMLFALEGRPVFDTLFSLSYSFINNPTITIDYDGENYEQFVKKLAKLEIEEQRTV